MSAPPPDERGPTTPGDTGTSGPTTPGDAGTSGPTAILRIALISHTNAGKTTLARTLLRRDVGEVVDEAHVTEHAAAYPLLELEAGSPEAPEGGAILLWDTPGFGDSATLVRRLEEHDDPLGWLAGQAFEEPSERPLLFSKRAVETVRQDADVVLYLVNASEEPEAAGYVDPEMRLLEWTGVPVIVLLNQAGPPVDAETRRKAEERWRWHLASHAAVRDVIHLDAFARCWVQEGLLLLRLQAFVPEPRRPLMDALIDRWRDVHLGAMDRSLARLAAVVLEAACDSEPVAEALLERRARSQAAAVLSRRLEASTRAALDDVIAWAELEGQAASGAQGALDDVSVPGDRPDPRRMGMWGGLAGGAMGGLVADLMHGGLTFGAGTVLGAIAGGLGLGGLAWGFDQVAGEHEPRVVWSPAFLEQQVRDAVLRYLAVAHFGRGSGAFQERARPAYWGPAVEAALRPHQGDLRSLLRRARDGGDPDRLRTDLAAILRRTVEAVLPDFYPGCERFLRR